MLTAVGEQGRVEADNATKGAAYFCANCHGPVVLKRGRIVVPHFAHKPPTTCDWARGETRAHLEAKKLFHASFIARGLKSEVEHVVATLPGDRRADVMVWSRKGDRAAIELQQSTISLPDIELRAAAYARAGIAQAWIPFLRASVWETATRIKDGVFVEKYAARPFEIWAHALHFGKLWYWDPKDLLLWRAYLEEHLIWVDSTSWYSEGGEEHSAGGYHRVSRKWRELTLAGPIELDQIRVRIEPRKPWSKGRYNVPGGRVAQLIEVHDN